MLFDTHCHIYDPMFEGKEEEVILNARRQNVRLLMLPGDNVQDSELAVQIAKRYPNVYAEVGIHPSEVGASEAEALQRIEALALCHPETVKAIGEIGLDYYWHKEKEEHEVQKRWFIAQIELANRLRLPIVIHSRDAAADTVSILREHPPAYGAVFHCFSYSTEILKEVLAMGILIGLDGPVTYKNAIVPKKVAEAVPLSMLLVETDSPYLTPVPYRGKRNEPAYLPQIVAEIARLKNVPFDTIADATFENGCRFFGVTYEGE